MEASNLEVKRRRSLSVLASINPLNYNVERWTYTLHRISGLVVGFYFFAHIYVTGQIIYGRGAWEAVMATMANPAVHLGEFIVLAFTVFHSLNGLRLFLIWQGLLVGRPGRLEFPYRPSFLGPRQRALMWLMLIFTVLFIIYGGYQIFLLQ